MPSAAEKRTPHRRSGASRPNVEKSEETTSRVYVDAGVNGGAASETQVPLTIDEGIAPEARMPGMERYGRRTYGHGTRADAASRAYTRLSVAKAYTRSAII